MPRPTNRLSARTVAELIRARRAGYHADGANLYLLVTADGTASWVFRYRRRRGPDDQNKAGKLREMGLGAANLFSLAEARQRATEPRKLLADGIDPLDHKRALQRPVAPRLWGAARDEYIEAHRDGWKNEAQAGQWTQSLKAYGPADDLPVAALDTDAVVACLAPLWKKDGKVETATRVRSRIERIWDAEKVKKHVAGENPARWRGHLEHLLPRASKIKRKRHHPAMPYAQVPAFYRRLAERSGDARDALRFTILTCARTNETIGAVPDEFAGKLWTVPPERMKGGEEHVVPLTTEALAILAGRPKAAPPFPLSDGGMLALLQVDLDQPYTVHGFRSSFHDWASEQGYAEHLIDMALAHKVSDEVKAAYRRTNLLKQRRELLEAWAAFVTATDPVAAAR